MVKAIFIDYTGTMVREDDPYSKELIGYILKNSDFKSPAELLKTVWEQIKSAEAESVGVKFIKNIEKINKVIDYCKKNYGLKADENYIRDIWQKVWIKAPLYDDVKPFFDTSTLPIYIISNDDMYYLEESMKEKNLNPTGIISADMVKACKPHIQIFKKALEVAGVEANEAIFIGDSIISDIEPAKQIGMNPVLICRKEEELHEGICCIKTLDELVLE